MKSLKLQLGEEVRKIAKAPEDITIVKQKASELFGIENPCFRYIDEDNDIITIFDQEEYIEAYKNLKSPFKLEVLNSDILILKRSSLIMGAIEEPSFKCDSMNSSKISIILPDLDKPQEHSVLIQTDEILIETKETMSISTQDKFTEACLTNDINLACENIIDSYQELAFIIKKQILSVSKEKIEFLGVKCSNCKADIYDVLYKCCSCSWLFLCEKCEVTDNHSHVLIKSRNKISLVKISEEKSIIPKSLNEKSIKSQNSEDISLVYSISEGKSLRKLDEKPKNILSSLILMDSVVEKPSQSTPKGSREDLNILMDKLRNMGFKENTKNIDALIKSGYDLERSIEILLNK